jgi:hypothetical protein
MTFHGVDIQKQVEFEGWILGQTRGAGSTPVKESWGANPGQPFC